MIPFIQTPTGSFVRGDGVTLQRHSIICDPWTMKHIPDSEHVSGQRLVVDHRGAGACAGCPPQGRGREAWNILIPPGSAFDHLRVRWDNPSGTEGQGRILPTGEEVLLNHLFHGVGDATRFLGLVDPDPDDPLWVSRPFPRVNSCGGVNRTARSG